MRKWLLSLLFISLLFFVYQSHVFAIVSEREEIFAFIQSAERLQYEQRGKTFSSKKELEDIFSSHFTREYSRFFIQEMYWNESGGWSVIPTDYFIGYIPPFSYDERTKIDDDGFDVIVSELIPANDFGPVTWDEYVATVTLANTKYGWIIKNVDGYLDETSYIDVYIDGLLLLVDEPPIMQNGRVLVPVRSLFETLDKDVAWIPKTKEIVVGGGEMRFFAGSNKAIVHGKTHTLDVAVQVVNGRTFIPLRFVSEQLGFSVEWDGKKRTVIISTKNRE